MILSMLCACGEEEPSTPVTYRKTSTNVLQPLASGINVNETEYAVLDYSNSNEGYVMAKYLGEEHKYKIQILTPAQIKYTYTLRPEYCTFPLPDGDGTYVVKIFQNIEGTSYINVLTQEVNVVMNNEFLPFLYPNQYVDFTPSTRAISLSEEISRKSTSDLDFINNVYNYVVENITYDYDKAENVVSGYTPDVDHILDIGTGICFDYSAIIATMLRTQGIPVRMEVGYAGTVYHAWISIYVKDIGWLNGFIQFDGTTWNRLDPTLASTDGHTKSVYNYITEDSNYVLKYKY